MKYEEYECLGGVQRLYKLPNGYTISAINSPMLHYYKFLWEFAVLKPDGNLDYSTPLTSDIVVCFSQKEADEFLKMAYEWSTHENQI
jgi:hypothetical protein